MFLSDTFWAYLYSDSDLVFRVLIWDHVFETLYSPQIDVSVQVNWIWLKLVPEIKSLQAAYSLPPHSSCYNFFISLKLNVNFSSYEMKSNYLLKFYVKIKLINFRLTCYCLTSMSYIHMIVFKNKRNVLVSINVVIIIYILIKFSE